MVKQFRSCIIRLFVCSPVKAFTIIAGIALRHNNRKQIPSNFLLNPSCHFCGIARRKYACGCSCIHIHGFRIFHICVFRPCKISNQYAGMLLLICFHAAILRYFIRWFLCFFIPHLLCHESAIHDQRSPLVEHASMLSSLTLTIS